jgi:ankyrin repeat protein
MKFSRLCITCTLAVFSVLSTAGCNFGVSKEVRDEFSDPQTQRLAQALLDNNGAKVTELIQKGADVNAEDTDGRSMLESAVWKDRHSAFEALLNAGADTAHRDKAGLSVLHYAGESENPVYVTELMARHLNPNVETLDHRTPLMLTVFSKNLTGMRALIGAGANLEVAESNGDTALIIAAETESLDQVIELLHAGANPRAGHRIQGRPDTTFQGFLNMTSENGMTQEGKRKRAEIREWLAAHNVPAEQPPSN